MHAPAGRSVQSETKSPSKDAKAPSRPLTQNITVNESTKRYTVAAGPINVPKAKMIPTARNDEIIANTSTTIKRYFNVLTGTPWVEPIEGSNHITNTRPSNSTKSRSTRNVIP